MTAVRRASRAAAAIECRPGHPPAQSGHLLETQLKLLPMSSTATIGLRAGNNARRHQGRPIGERLWRIGLSAHDGKSHHPTENLPHRPGGDSDCREDLRHPAPHQDLPTSGQPWARHPSIPIECFDASFIAKYSKPALKIVRLVRYSRKYLVNVSELVLTDI